MADFFQVVITKEANSNWHLFALMPSLAILVAYPIFVLTEAFPIIYRSKLYFIQFILIGIILSYQCNMNYQYIKSYDKAVKNISWSKAVYDLIKYTKNSPNKFVSIDWGIHAQLTAFDHVQGKYIELTFDLNYKNLTHNQEQWLLNLLSDLLKPDADYLFIAHPVESTYFKYSRNNFINLLRKRHYKLNLINKINDETGRTIFEIYSSTKEY